MPENSEGEGSPTFRASTKWREIGKAGQKIFPTFRASTKCSEIRKAG